MLLSLFTFVSFDGLTNLQILQRYSSFAIFKKCTKTGEAFLCCEDFVVVGFVETNFDAFFDSI